MNLSLNMVLPAEVLPKVSSKRAFTLAEVLITLSILGIVAALTIPSLINRQSDLAAKTKLKKAISNYESMAVSYMTENNVNDLSGLNCADLNRYFKTTTHNGCDFVTSDGVAWHWNQANSTATITDSSTAGQARYAVFMWAKNRNANTNGQNYIPSNLDTTLYPGVSYKNDSLFDAVSFIKGSSANPMQTTGGGSPYDTQHKCEIRDDSVYCFRLYLTCLVKGTMITMADGSLRPIEEIEAGDMVMSVNPKTWEIEPTMVTVSDSHMVKIANESDKWYFDDGTVIHTAHRHRFYCEETNSVKYLDEWDIGMHTCKYDGSSPQLIRHEKIDGDVQHFTLFTENQTYFANGLMSGNRNTLAFSKRPSMQLA